MPPGWSSVGILTSPQLGSFVLEFSSENESITSTHLCFAERKVVTVGSCGCNSGYIGCQGLHYETSGSCINKAKAVYLFSAISQACSLWLFGFSKVVLFTDSVCYFHG